MPPASVNALLSFAYAMLAKDCFAAVCTVGFDPYRGFFHTDRMRVIEKLTRLAPNFESLILRHTTFTPKHMGAMFGAPGGDYCHGLIHPDQMGPNRPAPKGYLDQPIPIDGLYLASAGCHGGPGITFVPGYNAAKQALADLA